MSTPDQNDVSTALGLLRDSLAEEEQRIRNEGASAMQTGDYDTATSVIEFAKRLLGFQRKVEGLVEECGTLEDLRDAASPTVQEIVSKRFFGKRRKGEVTAHTAYYRPGDKVLKVYDWARLQCDKGATVISCFHTRVSSGKILVFLVYELPYESQQQDLPSRMHRTTKFKFQVGLRRIIKILRSQANTGNHYVLKKPQGEIR